MKSIWRSEVGFSLVEVTLALGVAAFCLVALLGLLPVGLNSSQITEEQTGAASVARAILADLRNTPTTLPQTDRASPEFQITVPAGAGSASHTLFFGEAGQLTGAQDADAVARNNPRYRATLTFVPPANASLKNATMIRVLITWPALADAKAATQPSRYSGSLEIISALDRS